jgi:hypothetical protein
MHKIISLVIPLLLGMFAIRMDSPEVIRSAAVVHFGERVDFSAQVSPAEPLHSAFLVVRIGGAEPVRLAAVVDAGGGLTASWDAARRPIFPFAHVLYWWELETESGQTVSPTGAAFDYADDRFAWQELSQGRVVVHWIEGSPADTQDAANLTLLALGGESADLAAPIPDAVRVYIYPRLEDLRSALAGAPEWEGAASDAGSATILVAAAPGADGRRTLAILLPHEILHVLVGTKWPQTVSRVPAWLAEGLAASYEMEPRPDLDQRLRDGILAGSLIPFPALCAGFPSGEAPALLAYAESRSFIASIRAQYGKDAIRQALESYAGGAACQDGFHQATGKHLDDLERAWRETLAGRQPAAIPTSVIFLGGVGLLVVIVLAGWAVRRRRRHKPVREKSA